MGSNQDISLKRKQFFSLVPRFYGLPLLRTPSGEDLVSVIARVRKSGVREKKIVFSFKNLRNDMENSRSLVVSTILYFFIYMDHKRLK